MPVRRWAFTALVALAFLLAAFLLTGGLYRTVNAGNGSLYLVNRLTGSVQAVRGNTVTKVRTEEEVRRASLEAESEAAIRLARKASSPDDWPGCFEAALREQPNEVVVSSLLDELESHGDAARPSDAKWQAERLPSGSFLVSYTYQSMDGRLGWYWEVDTDAGTVATVNGNHYLSKHHHLALTPAREQRAVDAAVKCFRTNGIPLPKLTGNSRVDLARLVEAEPDAAGDYMMNCMRHGGLRRE